MNTPSDQTTIQPVDDWFDQLVERTLMNIEADSSKRVYRQTFRKWAAWCADNGGNPLNFAPDRIQAFLAGQDVTKATRQRQLSALRQLVETAYLATGDDDARRLVEVLKRLKTPTGEHNGKEHTRRALPPREADKVLRVWEKPTNFYRRNQALIAVLALGALRRSEAASLRWRDIDFENGVLTVAHGKGDKRREVPLAGDFALDALRAWQMCQEAEREFVFCPMLKGDRIGADKPVSGTDVYRIVQATAEKSGIDFKPHDLRRTFITEALDTGTALADVQMIAGHSQASTTLIYAKKTDARAARKKLNLRYG